MQNLIEFLGCGRISKRSNLEAVDFKVTKFSDISEKVIPFFERKPLCGLKHKNFVDFSKVADIIKVKGHLTSEGLERIIQIKAGMNTSSGEDPSGRSLFHTGKKNLILVFYLRSFYCYLLFE